MTTANEPASCQHSVISAKRPANRTDDAPRRSSQCAARGAAERSRQLRAVVAQRPTTITIGSRNSVSSVENAIANVLL